MANADKTAPSGPPSIAPRRPIGRLLAFLPLVGSIIVGVVFAWGLTRDPREIPSALVGKPVPAFDLPPVQGRLLGLSAADLSGEVSLVNVFASWCAACREEHPLLLELKAEGDIPIHGLNYKDKPEDAARWLDTLGDPYTRTGADRSGRVAIDWGVYGVPETFVVSAEGRIVHKHIGPLTRRELEETILPLVERLRSGAANRTVARELEP
ncbi:DsbE family thiol:disulfide interchange protein [Nisaea sp.]|jgi:cytochrome c biogenesis protein CcmG/thiol:disulfide interchange protein DsbE|uniref:DsbE family thiol:disulfide interchange protein n=1 Tax=Nisaea sp. TaxID=2024842 RepID=UPI003B52C508